MIDKPLPYYKWFWQDFRANRKVQRMSYIERGLYRDLLDECWADGSIPNDLEELAEICGCPDDVLANAWQVLSKCFVDRGDGRLVNEKLESLRTDTDKTRLARAESGKKGAIAKQMPSNSSANASNCHIEEKRREEKSKGEKKNTVARAPDPPVGVSESVWSDFLKVRKAKKAPMTDTALEGIAREAQKAGWTLEDAIRECGERNWTSFKAEWVNKPVSGAGPPARGHFNKQEALEASNRAVVQRLLEKEGYGT